MSNETKPFFEKDLEFCPICRQKSLIIYSKITPGNLFVECQNLNCPISFREFEVKKWICQNCAEEYELTEIIKRGICKCGYRYLIDNTILKNIIKYDKEKYCLFITSRLEFPVFDKYYDTIIFESDKERKKGKMLYIERHNSREKAETRHKELIDSEYEKWNKKEFLPEFKINDFITLKYENRMTMIYVNNESFMQCIYLLLNISSDKIGSYNEIRSIDEAAENLDQSMEGSFFPDSGIPSETEFWAHCSNLQVWSENNYDTRLLHSNLAFPLLKKLTEAGDLLAKRVFKEEIAKRFASGHLSVMQYLLEEKYLDYLNKEENYDLLEMLREKGIQFVEYKGRFCGLVKNNELDLCNRGIRDISKINGLKDLTNLQVLNLKNNSIEKINGLEKLHSLKVLNLAGNQIVRIEGLEKLGNLKRLYLDFNQISDTLGIQTLSNLRTLNLDNNNINAIKNISKLKKFRLLSILVSIFSIKLNIP